ncbi:transporter substrate-binding domain-containing protein (plasmid) [Thioclava sp. 'Guangxiensis']|uniref:substrate-binding periplasmic protein n=1 Tax=Thioclava sp. 'Guangxiensis' TaxID=3149044 RepID=UPI0032C402C4
MLRRLISAALLAACLPSLASAADLDAIRERGKLIAVTTGNLPPNTFVDKNNELTGFDIDVAHYIEKKIGVPIEISRLDWKGILPGLQAGRFDAVFSNVNMTPERLGMFEYSIPYSRSAIVVVRSTKATDINGYDSLVGKRVGGIAGGNDGEIPARAIAKEYGDFKKFTGYAGYTEMFRDLQVGRIDAVIAPELASANFIRENPGIAEIVGKPYSVVYVGVPMQPGSDKLKAAIDGAIREMRENGTLDALAKKYFGIEHFSDQLIDEVPH